MKNNSALQARLAETTIWSKKFCAICIYTPSQIFELYCEYIFEGLHIYILESTLLLQDNLNLQQNGMLSDHTLYQWGTAKQLFEKSRHPCVNERRRRLFGNIGIGSVASGSCENRQGFINGGEAFIWFDQAFRITKGGKAFPMKLQNKYSLLQICNFNNPILINGFEFYGTRDEFAKQLAKNSGLKNTIYLATFNCYLHKEYFLARSNGLFPDDNVDNAKLDIFEDADTTAGGHLLDYQNKIGLLVESPILLKPLHTIKILTEQDKIIT